MDARVMRSGDSEQSLLCRVAMSNPQPRLMFGKLLASIPTNPMSKSRYSIAVYPLPLCVADAGAESVVETFFRRGITC